MEASPTKPAAADLVASVPLRPLSIHVVDDDPAVLNSLRFLLETEGFEVRTFRSGAALLNAEGARPADCFVIDYKMDAMGGLDLAARLRAKSIQTPIILITGFPDEDIPAKAAAAGAQCVLIKPHLEDSLAAHINAAVRQANARAGE